MTGYDIFKYFKLLLSLNVADIDYVNSNDVYFGNNAKLKAYFKNNFNKSKLFVQLCCSAIRLDKAHMA